MSDYATEEKPIACSLNGKASKERFAWIAKLNRDGLQSHKRYGLALELRYALHTLDRVRELVRLEQDCCAFLTFEIKVEPNDVLLTVTAPESAREAADLLFEEFIVSARSSTCGCSPTTEKVTKGKSGVSGKAVGGVALVSAAGAVAACSACVIPLALPVVLLASFSGVLAWLYSAHIWITGIAVVALAIAWICVWRQSARLRMRPASLTLALMSIATFFIVLALLWPGIEVEILRFANA